VLTTEDWLRGGYEPSINIWGPIEGEQTVEASLESARIAWTPEIEDPEVGSSRFVDFKYAPPATELVTTVTTDHGTALAATPPGILWPDVVTAEPTAAGAQVPRATGVARFVFRGGDPLVDAPVITVEREDSPGQFKPLVDERGLEASSVRADVIVTYAPFPLTDKVPTAHSYAATWQPVPAGVFSPTDAARPFSLPTGNYRLHARGKALAAAGAAPVDYDVTSPVFALVAAPLAPTSVFSLTGSSLAITAALGDAPGLRALSVQGASDQDVPLLPPWTITVTPSAGAPVVFKDVTPTGNAATVTLDASVTGVAAIEVRDSLGNGGPLTMPPAP
jgi:neutral ceramidase